MGETDGVRHDMEMAEDIPSNIQLPEDDAEEVPEDFPSSAQRPVGQKRVHEMMMTTIHDDDNETERQQHPALD